MVDWSDLSAELDRWAAEGKRATLWWRDDDAVQATTRLDRLMQVAARTVPVAFAVIPALAQTDLPELLAASGSCVLQHGWRHIDHAGVNGPNEYPGSRDESEVSREIADGRQRLCALFGSAVLAAFVPPFHAFDERFLRLLPANGILAISRIGERYRQLPRGLFEMNVHVGLLQWTAPPSFVGDSAALAAIVNNLRARRIGQTDPDAPTGILTHHLVQDEASYAFLARLRDATVAHRGARWVDARECFRH